MYLNEYKEWWKFRYDASAVLHKLAEEVRKRQGRVLGELSAVGFSIQDDAQLPNLMMEIVKSSENEVEMLNLEQVRSSIAFRLGIPTAGKVPGSR